TMPTWPRLKRARPSSPSDVISVPAIWIRPDVTASSPAATMRRDDFPDPDGPRRATVSPAATHNDTPARMFTGPAELDNVSVTSSKLMATAELCIGDSDCSSLAIWDER